MYLHRVKQIQDLLVEMVERKEICAEGKLWTRKNGWMDTVIQKE